MRCGTLTRRCGFFARMTAIALAIGCIGFVPASSFAATTTTHPTTMHKMTPKKTSKKSKGSLRERIHRRLEAFSKNHGKKKPAKTTTHATHTKQARAKVTKNHQRNAKSNRKPHTTGRTV